jgi:hypothetical protein
LNGQLRHFRQKIGIADHIAFGFPARFVKIEAGMSADAPVSEMR